MMPTPYERLGGEQALRALVDRFYDLMDELPEAWEIRKLHAEDLSGAREKLYLFLSGWMGGPPLYVEKYGHPRLRARHLPFPIGIRERDQWLKCMKQAMEDTGVDEKLRNELWQAFARTADHMRNQMEPSEERFNIIG
ncbi:MAG: group II truncated hemoglobin [Chromatiales bacterium]|nr:group II truncated hemoglobin [Chromatiales bacterium]